jgi:predicted metal-dependent hydrolase
MNGSVSAPTTIVPRTRLDFGLDGDIPRFWFGGDAFKTRFFDAMSTLFPEGEKFFINCVRDYRDQVSDPELKAQIGDFMCQEAQHGRVHDQFNARLAAQGVRVDRIEAHCRKVFTWLRGHLPASFTLAMTAAAEHMTAIMAHGFFERSEIFAEADPRLRALYVWHGVEEIEHKAVAFDVLTKTARGGWLLRCTAMLYETLMFPLYVLMVMQHMFKVDGFSFRQRLGLWARGLAWMYGRNGLYRPLLGHYFAYFKPGFHPWQAGEMNNYRRWVAAYESSGDPIAAADAAQVAAAA